MAIKLQGTNSAAAPGLTNDGGDGVVVGTDSVEISTGGTSRVKVDSAGKVGIGTTTNAASEQLTVLGSTSSEFQNGFYRNYTTGARGFNLNIGAKKSDGTLVAGTQITGEVDQTDCTSGQFAIKTLTAGTDSSSLTEKLRVDSSGNLTISEGNLKIGTSGKGIDFSATSDATGKDSELLDDYEEGTFTPTWYQGASSITYHIAQGNYTKIGRYVYGHLYLYTSCTGDSDHLKIGGLPFTSGNGANAGYGGANNTYTSSGMFSGLSGGNEIRWHIPSSATVMNAYSLTGGGVDGDTTGVTLHGKELLLSFYYHTA